MQAEVALFCEKMKFFHADSKDFAIEVFAFSTIKNNWIRGAGLTLPCTPAPKKLRLLG